MVALLFRYKRHYGMCAAYMAAKYTNIGATFLL